MLIFIDAFTNVFKYILSLFNPLDHHQSVALVTHFLYLHGVLVHNVMDVATLAVLSDRIDATPSSAVLERYYKDIVDQNKCYRRQESPGAHSHNTSTRPATLHVKLCPELTGACRPLSMRKKTRRKHKHYSILQMAPAWRVVVWQLP